MPPSERPIPRFAAEPPQEPAPYGRWAETLAERFRAACRALPDAEELGEPGEIEWFPDRTYSGRTFVPAAAPAPGGGELYGFVSFERDEATGEAVAFRAHAEYTQETAEANPDWALDLSDHELGTWRGREGQRGEMTLVWGTALVPNGAVATAELGPTTTDQCILVAERFTLVSLDNYTGDLLEVRLYGPRGAELAAESLYEEE